MTAAAHAHPTPKTYWITALALMVVTAVEVGIVYVSALDSIVGVLLILLGGAKFVVVAAVFMHLRYDLRSYRFYFTIGLAGALAVFAVVLATFHAL